ncbi:MAG: hypothetical protein ABFE01_26410 [Phycisphaerales bacterium]|jgi:hypothetical protein
MTSITIDNNELKALLKQALVELLEEKNQVLYDAMAEVVEEIGLVNAIQEGQAGTIVDKEEMLKALEREG